MFVDFVPRILEGTNVAVCTIKSGAMGSGGRGWVETEGEGREEDSESRCKYCSWCEVLVGDMCDAELIVGLEKRKERERQPNDGCRESGVREREQKDGRKHWRQERYAQIHHTTSPLDSRPNKQQARCAC